MAKESQPSSGWISRPRAAQGSRTAVAVQRSRIAGRAAAWPQMAVSGECVDDGREHAGSGTQPYAPQHDTLVGVVGLGCVGATDVAMLAAGFQSQKEGASEDVAPMLEVLKTRLEGMKVRPGSCGGVWVLAPSHPTADVGPDCTVCTGYMLPHPPLRSAPHTCARGHL